MLSDYPLQLQLSSLPIYPVTGSVCEQTSYEAASGIIALLMTSDESAACEYFWLAFEVKEEEEDWYIEIFSSSSSEELERI